MAHTTTREQKTRMLCTAGLMAALACVSNFISIATPASRIHIGNAVCVLCGLILGPAYGFFAAGVGNAIFDIIGGYGMEFVITFINKGAIALVTGLIAYKAAGKETLEGRDHARVIVGSILGALTYTALYLLKSYIKLRFTTADVDPVAIQATMLSKAASSLFNAAFAFVVAPIFFNVLRKPLRRLALQARRPLQRQQRIRCERHSARPRAAIQHRLGRKAARLQRLGQRRPRGLHRRRHPGQRIGRRLALARQQALSLARLEAIRLADGARIPFERSPCVFRRDRFQRALPIRHIVLRRFICF